MLEDANEVEIFGDMGDGLADLVGDATYSPEDHKLHIYPFHRLASEAEAMLREAGFVEVFERREFEAVATPEREEVAITLCGDIADARAARGTEVALGRVATAGRIRALLQSLARQTVAGDDSLEVDDDPPVLLVDEPVGAGWVQAWLYIDPNGA